MVRVGGVPQPENHRRRTDGETVKATWAIVAAFVAAWLVGAVTSRGFLEDDAWAHYLYSRTAWNNPAYLADVWGRPVCTGVYALGAWSGILATRVVSLLLVLAAVEL